MSFRLPPFDGVEDAQQAALRGVLVAALVPAPVERLQQKCSDWGAYWRAPDAHGVILSREHAEELLRDALGVEVEVATPPARRALTEADVPTLTAACQHAIADARNPVIKSGYVCVRCGALFSAADHG